MLVKDLERRLTLNDYALWVAYFKADAEDRKKEMEKAKVEAKAKASVGGRGRRRS